MYYRQDRIIASNFHVASAATLAQLWPIQNEIKVGSEFVKHIISTYGLLEKHAITDRRLISFDLNNGASERCAGLQNPFWYL